MAQLRINEEKAENDFNVQHVNETFVSIAARKSRCPRVSIPISPSDSVTPRLMEQRYVVVTEISGLSCVLRYTPCARMRKERSWDVVFCTWARDVVTISSNWLCDKHIFFIPFFILRFLKLFFSSFVPFLHIFLERFWIYAFKCTLLALFTCNYPFSLEPLRNYTQ